MIPRELTGAGSAATSLPMQEFEQQGRGRFGWGAGRAAAMLAAGARGRSGCVPGNAAGKAMAMELNINIKQEVISRLATEVKNNIEANPEIF